MQASLPLFRLHALLDALDVGSQSDGLQQQVALAAGLIGAASCSVMLVDSSAEGGACMRIHAHHGLLPDAALQAAIRRGEGISGRVLASGAALLVADIRESDFFALARRGEGLGCSLICAPLRIEGRVIGVLNAANARDAAPFDQAALCMLQLAALFMGRQLHVRHLQHLLDSRFAQLALLRETAAEPSEADRLAYRDPDQVAKILARSFFREMHRAGFGPAPILSAASELIGQLNQDIQKD